MRHATFLSFVSGYIFILHFTVVCEDTINVIAILLTGKCDETLNIAGYKTAEQSSQNLDHPASLAVDGSRDGSRIPGFPDRDGQFSHTDLNSPQWWMVDLGKVFYVSRVRLWNRLGFGKYCSIISGESSMVYQFRLWNRLEYRE